MTENNDEYKITESDEGRRLSASEMIDLALESEARKVGRNIATMMERMLDGEATEEELLSIVPYPLQAEYAIHVMEGMGIISGKEVEEDRRKRN